MPNSPKKITEEQFNHVCERIATSTIAAYKACKEVDASYLGLIKYIEEHKPDAGNKYARAKQEQAEFLANEIIEIADEPVQSGDSAAVNDKRVRIDSRKWVAAHLKPSVYGDTITVNDPNKALPTVLKIELVQPKAQQQIDTDKQDISDVSVVSD